MEKCGVTGILMKKMWRNWNPNEKMWRNWNPNEKNVA